LGHYVRVPFAGGPPVDITPDLPPYASWGLTHARGGTRLSFLLADPTGAHLYAVDLAGDSVGAPRELHHSPSILLHPALSYDGEIAAVASSERAGHLHFSILALDGTTGAVIAELADGPGSSVEPRMFAPRPGDPRLLAMTNRSGNTRPLIWNPATGERTDLDLAGLDGEIWPLDWSADGDEILLCQIAQARHQL
jgi:Tol biopolymer transport system component